MKSWAQRPTGFTIVELLIVIVVIAILAAITIVSYNGIQSRARVSAISTDLKQNSKAIGVYAVQSGIDNYPEAIDCSATPATNTICIKANDSTLQYSVNNTSSPKTFCLTQTKGNLSYYITVSGNPTEGACPGQIAAGAPTVTNYSRNPRFTGPGSPVNQSNTTATIASYNSSNMAQATAGTASDAIMRLDTNSYRWAISPGQTVYTSGTVYNAAPGPRSLTLGVRYYDSAGGTTGSTVTPNGVINAAPQTIAAGGSYAFTISDTAPTGTVSVAVMVTRLTGTGSAAADVFYADNIYLSNAPGGMADGTSPGWTWSGTPDASTSSGPQATP